MKEKNLIQDSVTGRVKYENMFPKRKCNRIYNHTKMVH